MKKIIYIVIVALLTVSLLTEFFVKQFGLDLGSWSWIGTWVSSVSYTHLTLPTKA